MARFYRRVGDGARSVRQSSRKRRLRLEILEDRRLLASDFHNAANPPDVNGSGYVSLADTLAVVSDLRNYGIPHNLTTNPPAAGDGQYYDIVENGLVDLADLLATIQPQRDGAGQPSPVFTAEFQDGAGEGETGNLSATQICKV